MFQRSIHGNGVGSGQKGKGKMGGNKPGSGPGGNCLCPNCGNKVPHKQGIPCKETICTKCGSQMMRE